MEPILDIMLTMLAVDRWRWTIFLEDQAELTGMNEFPTAEQALANAREFLFLNHEIGSNLVETSAGQTLN